MGRSRIRACVGGRESRRGETETRISGKQFSRLHHSFFLLQMKEVDSIECMEQEMTTKINRRPKLREKKRTMLATSITLQLELLTDSRVSEVIKRLQAEEYVQISRPNERD